VNALVFERPQAARLLDALRDAVCPCIALVAVDGERMVEDILFTSVAVV
jgi:hypothetical protein